MVEPLTRKQLYELVWQRPISQIAKDYGLSDRGLGKLCVRNDIPVPPRGYWARLRAGQKLEKYSLPKININRLDKFILSPTIKSNEEVTESVQKMIENEKRTENKIIVPIKISKHHQLIKEMINGSKSPLERRRDRIINCFLFAMELHGYEVQKTNSYCKFSVIHEKEHICFEINEYIKKHKRKLTEKEEKTKQYTSQKWAYDEEQTGKLKLSLYSYIGYYEEKMKNYIDKPSIPIENILNDALILIHKEIWTKKEKRLQEEEKLRKCLEERRRKIEEQKKREALLQHTSDWVKAENIRHFISAVKNNENLKENPIELESWIKWALEYADEIDPITCNEYIIREAQDEELDNDYDRENC